jgi:hypothetical protein
MLAYTGLTGTSAVSHPGECGNHLDAVDREAVDLRAVVGMAAILPNTAKELKHEVWVETSRLSGCNGVVNFA